MKKKSDITKKKSNRRKEIKFYMRQNLNTAHIARLTGMTIVGVRYYIKRYKLSYPQVKLYSEEK